MFIASRRNIPDGRSVLRDWLGATGSLLELASLPNLESGSLLVMMGGGGELAVGTEEVSQLWR